MYGRMGKNVACIIYMGIVWLGAGMLNGTDMKGVKTLSNGIFIGIDIWISGD